MEAASGVTAVITRPGRHVRVTGVSVTALAATVGLGAASWVLTVHRMHGMDMGVATRLGSFPYFLSIWVPMMAAMMLPGTAPAALRLEQAGRGLLDVPRYIGAYLGVWALVGVIVFAAYRPHASVTAGAFTLAAGVYELTPMKRQFRKMCRVATPSGLGLGLCCVGSTVGLMLMMVALGVMSLTWMALVAGVVVAQKLLPPRAALDVPVALAIVAFGIVILVSPSLVPGLLPGMRVPMPSM